MFRINNVEREMVCLPYNRAVEYLQKLSNEHGYTLAMKKEVKEMDVLESETYRLRLIALYEALTTLNSLVNLKGR